ncbi:hypothetical protein [Corynebacterium appendicis]|uniref:hypothetical protein n=1 Tax=Corynebacterium appendicis TaxID=163202 RepID=UPI003C6C7DCC
MERPDYDAMVASLKRGELDAIICIDRAEEHGLKLVTANGDGDLRTDGGRMFARVKAAVARIEVECKGARSIGVHHPPRFRRTRFNRLS